MGTQFAPSVDPMANASALASQADTAVPAPGKQTQIGPVGHDYIDGGAYCERPGAKGNCPLTERQRDRLVSLFRERMDKAARSYQLAIEHARVDKLLEKDADLSWVLGLLVDVASVNLMGAVSGCLKLLGSRLELIVEQAGLNAMFDGVANSTNTWMRVHTVLAGIDQQAVLSNVKGVTDSVKKSVRAAATTMGSNSDRNAKADTVNYLTNLQDKVELQYSYIGEHLPVTVDDVQLIALLDAADPSHHTIAIYTALLHEKLQRYERSGVRDIGYNLGASTHVVWATFVSGSPKELLLQDRPQAPSLRRNAVADEFWDIAIQRHRGAWGTDPETVHVDDSTYIWDPIRAAKAVKNKGTMTTSVNPFVDGAIAKANQLRVQLQQQSASSSPSAVAVPAQLQLRPSPPDRSTP